MTDKHEDDFPEFILPPFDRHGFLEEVANPEKICRCQRKHPRVTVDLDRLTMEVSGWDSGGYGYAINLERCRNPAGILNKIYQLNGKAWMTDELMGQLIQAFDCATSLVLGGRVQGMFCPCGTAREHDWDKERRG